MKKTEKTALTAAIFAAAMYGTANAAAEPVEAGAAFTSTTTSVVGMDIVADNQSGISIDAIKELNSKMSTVYGPPPSDYDYSNNYDEEDVVTTTQHMVALYAPPEYMTTTAPDEYEFEDWTTTTVINTTAIHTVYGPPSVFTTTTTVPDIEVATTTTDYVIAELQTNGQPVYGPAPLYGDVNADNRVDVFDMIKLREEFAKGSPSYSFATDVNNDYKVSVADLVILQKYLLGKIDDIRYPEDENIITTTNVIDDEASVTTTTVTFAPLYGPPSVFQ